MKYLIAKNHEQGMYHAKKMGLGKNDFKIITRARQLRGLRLDMYEAIRVGEWWDNEDIFNIKDLLPALFKN